MELSLFYFTYFLFILLSTADSTELNTNSCPTSRRLLFFAGFNFPFGEKKSEHISSSSKSSPPSFPSKYARAANSHGLIIYIRPQTSNELGQKVRSYSHLLKSKLFTKEEREQLKKLQLKKKNSSSTKKKNTTQPATKTRDLVAINDDDERDRCRALLHIDHQTSLTPTKEIKKTKQKKKPEKNSISSKVKNLTTQAKKKVATKIKSSPINDKKKSKNVKPSKSNIKPVRNEKKKPSETQPLTPPPVNEVPSKHQTTPPPPPPPPPNTKPKREKPPPPVNQIPIEPLDMDESIDMDNDEKNNSVVGRAYHFVKNMFQLSDDILENNHTHEEDQILSSTNEQQHRQSRKLLSVVDDINNYELEPQEALIATSDDSLSSIASISKRQLLSVKTSKHSTSSKEKKINSDANKPKVGWTYRYRISRYLADPKTKRSGHANKGIGEGKSKQQQQQSNSKQSNKKISSSSDTKVSKRKLLERDSDDESSVTDDDDISNEDIVNSVLITQDFVPKRQLLSSKKSKKKEEETDDEKDEEDIDRINERRRIKSYEELTDPLEIIRSYDRGLFKPRVGWQFRYRVSRYIDSLRENIREDQQRLKLGLQAIKRKTPQELSGRRKRVLDKPFAAEPEETPAPIEENKPNVGWRYRYRISKMLEAKRRGVYVDDEEEKRKARLEPKHKPGLDKSTDDDSDCLEWEYDLDPELRKISEEGRRVGWAYRYRIRRRLDELKQNQAETGISFDLKTLGGGGGGQREKKVIKSATSPKVVPEEKPVEINKKAVGWQYRYRVSKMLEAQKQEALTKSTSKKHDQVPAHEKLHPGLAQLAPEDRVVGWQYRYRIRRKLDAMKDAARETEGGKRSKKQLSKRKDKEKIIKQVEESIEKILNIDDIDETPFMEYFRRTSSYIFFGLIPTARKSICLLPLPVKLSFCKQDDNKETLTTTEGSKQSPVKKLRTKKEKRAKQFIHSRVTKLDTIDDPIKPLSKPPTTPVEKPQKKPSRQRVRSSIRRNNDEQIKHFDEEEQPVKKLVGVESKTKKNKKKFQIIGKEVKIKHKHSTNPAPVSTTTPSIPLTTTHPPPVAEVTPSIPITTTRRSPVVTTPPPLKEVPKTTPPETIPTTTHAPLRTISQLIQEEEAAALLSSSTKSTYSEEVKEETNEANEILQRTTTPSSSVKEDSDSTSSDSESDSNDSESSSDSNSNEENSDPSPVKNIKQFDERAKENVHGALDLKDHEDSS